MRRLAAAMLAGAALAGAVSLAAGAGPVAGGEERTAEFVRETCLAALDDPANLERIAEARDWPRFIDRSSAQPSFMTVIGTWRATADDDSMLISVATSVSGGRPQTICTIVFEDTPPSRAGFLRALTNGWRLDTIIDSSSPQLRNEMYAVRPPQAADMTLQISSTGDGGVMSTTLLATK